MTDKQRLTAEVLNELHAAEAGRVLLRLPDLHPFVSLASTGQAELVRRIAAAAGEHRAWLAEAIQACRGALWPAPPDATTASLHYLSIEALVPRLENDLQQLVQHYAAAERQPLTLEAIELIQRIAARHRRHLDELHALLAPAN